MAVLGHSNLSRYPNGFGRRGVSIRGVPVLSSFPNKVFWVHSGTGLDGNDGSENAPFATIDRAFTFCTANRGDVIMVKAGHAETIAAAAGIDADVAGVSIVGLGSGADMPELTFSATASDIDIDAANITIKGIRFLCAVASLTAGVDVNSTDFTLEDCEFYESGQTGLVWVDINGGGANACDRAKIIGNRFYCATAGNWDRAIELGEVADGVEIIGNIIVGDFDDAGIHNITGKVLTNLLIANNYVRNNQAGQHAIELVSACTGSAFDNRLVTNAQTTSFDAGALSCMGNLWQITTGGDSEGSPPNPAGDDATNFIGVDDADNAASTSSVVRNVDGSVLERLEDLQADLVGTAGVETFPAAAAPADAVSLAEVLRSIWARNIAGINPLGTVIFVAASGGSDANAGTSPNAAKATIAAAITAAGAGGTIVLGPGTHSVDVSAGGLVPLANQQFVSAIPSFGGAPRAVIANDLDDGVSLVVIDVDGTVWRDIEFRNITAATACITHLSVAQTTAVRGIHIENCWFNQGGLDGAMISLAFNDATNAITGAVVKNCRFTGGTGTTASIKYIQVGVGGVPGGLFEYNVFECQSADNDARAFDFLDPTTSGKSYGVTIRYNDFIGPSDNGLDAAPLQFAAAMTEGEIIGMIRTNYFSNCATPPIPIDLVNNSVVFNYGNDNATGGTLVDPGT